MSQTPPAPRPNPFPPPPAGAPRPPVPSAPPPGISAPPAPALKRSGPSPGLLAAAILLAGIATALGYYTITLLQSRRADRQELETTKQVVADLRSAQTESLAKDKEQTQRLQENEQALVNLRAELESAQTELKDLRQVKADSEAVLRDFRDVAARFQRMVDAGKLKVSMRRGRMVVDLPARVLFASGSAELSDDGQASLREVAKVLRGVKGKRFIVGGHSDNIGLRASSPFTSNWALSAARAVTVTEALVRSGLRASNLVAAGYGPHDPIRRNSTKAGRKANRRIEIILEPKLRGLPSRIEKKL